MWWINPTKGCSLLGKDGIPIFTLIWRNGNDREGVTTLGPPWPFPGRRINTSSLTLLCTGAIVQACMAWLAGPASSLCQAFPITAGNPFHIPEFC
jgi:hypothetical protein